MGPVSPDAQLVAQRLPAASQRGEHRRQRRQLRHAPILATRLHQHRQGDWPPFISNA